MKQSWNVAAIGIAVLGVAVLAATAGENVFVHAGGGTTVELKDLRDGETRTFGEGERQVTATRDGSIVTILTDGSSDRREVRCDLTTDACSITEDAEGGKAMVWISKESTCEGGDCTELDHDVIVLGDGHSGHSSMVIREGGTCGEGEDCTMNVFVRRVDDPGAIHVIAGPEGADAMLRVMEPRDPRAALRCPEGDTIMRVDPADEGEVFLCPKHAMPLDRVEVKTRQVWKSTDSREY